jgi:hypothetical protein
MGYKKNDATQAQQIELVVGENVLPLEVVGGRLRVTAGQNEPTEPTYVVISNGDRVFHMDYAKHADTPAHIESGASGPFNIGGQDLTIEIDGEDPDTVASFDTRAAQEAFYVTGVPSIVFPYREKEKLKVSVDGGELLEVKIGKPEPGHADYDAIAAALQTQIRANVENGANVTVEWNTSEYPFRFLFKSGTTGNSAVMHVEKGGDDLYKHIKVGADYGGREEAGTDANTYRDYEATELLNEKLHDVICEHGSPISITTKAGGSGASLHVTAGGANTAFQFPTTLVSGQAGTGSKNMAVNGSSTPSRFTVPVPSGKVFVANQMMIVMQSEGAQLKKFGGSDELTNGITIEFRMEGQPFRTLIEAKTNGELFAYADDGEILIDAINGDEELVKAIFNFDGGIRIREGTTDAIQVTIQDDLETDAKNTYIYAVAKGWLEA